MITIRRLLTYEFLDVKTAVHCLQNRAVKGIQYWGHNTVKEAFYLCGSIDAEDIVTAVVPDVHPGYPPDGFVEVTNEPK